MAMNAEVKSEFKEILIHIKKLIGILYQLMMGGIKKFIITHPIAVFRIMLILSILIIFVSYMIVHVKVNIAEDQESAKSYSYEHKIDSMKLVHEADSIIIHDLKSKLSGFDMEKEMEKRSKVTKSVKKPIKVKEVEDTTSSK